MSKSLGNFTTIRALLGSGVSPMTLRLFVLQAHYRKPLDFTAEALEAAAAGWRGLAAALAVGDALPEWRTAAAAGLPADLEAFRQRFIDAMDDDLNTAAALGDLFELARPLRSLASRLRIGDAPGEADRQLLPRWRLLRELAGVLGLQAEGTGDSAPGQEGESLEESEIERLVARRREAKARRDYGEADRVRDQLRRQGIDLVDKPGGVTVWLRR
jgi:cysteinyl-tRNA synthetase